MDNNSNTGITNSAAARKWQGERYPQRHNRIITITPKSRKGNRNMVTMNVSDLLKLIQLSATNFLNIADRLNEEVTAYINGSHEASHEAAYHMVKDANSIFIQLYNMYYNENRVPSLDYELAESLIL